MPEYPNIGTLYFDGRTYRLLTKSPQWVDVLREDGWQWFSSVLYHDGIVLHTTDRIKAWQLATERALPYVEKTGLEF